MSDDKDVTFSMKVMINKQKTQVLFAEIDNDLADVLLSFVTLPLGQIVRVLKKHYGDEATPKIGSITTLYNGLANLSSVHFLTEGCKEMILNPRSSFHAQFRKLKIDISGAQPTRFFICGDLTCINMYNEVPRCPCGVSGPTREVELDIIDDDDSAATANHNGVFTNKISSFVITHNLMMVPNVAVSIMETLNDLGIADIGAAELRNVTIGFNEIMDLLKVSLLSQTPLTDLILKKRNLSDSAIILPHPIIPKEESPSNFKKISLKLMVQECNNKLLFAQSGADFVDFLCSLLTIPLAGAHCLLGNHTGFYGIDSLLWSIDYRIDAKYFASRYMKTMLMTPKLPYGYLPRNRILPLVEQGPPRLYYHYDEKTNKEWLSPCINENDTWVRVMKGQGAYVNGPTKYMITDDLTVTPLSLTSSFSFLNERRIPLSDVKEVDVQIGLEQALGILRASLTSTTALTDGLRIYSLLEKQPQKAVNVTKVSRSKIESHFKGKT